MLAAVLSLLSAHGPWFLATFQTSCQEDINYLSKMSLGWCWRNDHVAFPLTGSDLPSHRGDLGTAGESSDLLRESAGPSAMLCPRDWPASSHSCRSICRATPGSRPCSPRFTGAQSGSRGWPSLPQLQNRSYTQGRDHPARPVPEFVLQ